jgi:hypothetical protein
MTYRIEDIYDASGPITLHLRKYDCPRQIETKLLVPKIAGAFQRVREMNHLKNGEASTMYLTYFGCAPFDGVYPTIRISGRRFVRCLF